jgi:hypothetical protein
MMIHMPQILLLQLPCILWLKIKKPRKFSVSWFANWVGTEIFPAL